MGTFQQTCTGKSQPRTKPGISNQTSSRKKPQIQPKIWITNLILSSRGSTVPAVFGYWPLLCSSSLLHHSLRLSLARTRKCWTAVSRCERRESSFNLANNASIAASAISAAKAASAVMTTPRGSVCVPVSTGFDRSLCFSVCLT